MVKVLVGIPVFNGSKYIRECLLSILASTLSDDVSLEVIVVDDASTDGTSKIIATEFPTVKLFRHEDNLGVARSNNELLSFASNYDHFLRADADTIFEPRAIVELVKFLQENPKVGLVSARIVNPAGEDSTSYFNYFQSPTHWFKEYNFLITRGWRKLFKGNMGNKGNVGWEVKALASTAIMARMSAVSKVGEFDENLPFFLEDSDWAKRFLDAGFEVYVNRHAIVTHIGGSSNERVYIMCREQSLASLYRFTDKHFPGIVSRWLLLTSVLGGTLINLVVTTLILPTALSLAKVRQIVFKNFRSFGGVLKWHLEHLGLFLNKSV